MEDERFKRAEDQFMELKKGLAAGSVTTAQFRGALQSLAVQDARGRLWHISENGKWYLDERESVAPEEAYSRSTPDSLPEQPRVSRALTRIRPIAFVLLAVLFLLDAAGMAYFLVKSAPSRSSPIVAASSPAGRGAPEPGASIVVTPTTELTGTITVIPPAPAPTVNAAIPTTAPAAVASPTAVPLASPSPGAVTSPAATEVPAGLYVTSVRTTPPTPRRNQDVVFFATFLNIVGKPQTTPWTVLVYRPNELRNAFGQTGIGPLPNMAAGSVEVQATGTWKLTGPGNCENFLVRVAAVDPNKALTFFKKPDGQVFEQTIAVCP